MKYLTFVEYGPDDMEKVSETYNETSVVRETTPDKFPKVVLDVHLIHGDLPKLTENFRAFTVHETDDPQQLEEMLAHWFSKAQELKSFRIHLLPITEFPSLSSKVRKRRKTSQ